MSERETLYRFGPLERRAFLLGRRGGQLAGLGVAGVLALVVLRTGGAAGLLGAVLVIAAGAAIFLVPFRHRTLDEWTPLVVRFFVGRWTRRARFRAQLGQVGHVVVIPDGGLTPEPPDEPECVPAELAGIELLEGELAGYEGAPRMGVAKDRRGRTYTATLRCQGQGFSLLGAEDRAARLAEYGGVLAALARDESPLRRLAWVERTLPADGDAMARYLRDAMRPDDSLDNPSRELVSYLQLLDRAGDVSEDHELLLSVQMDASRAAGRRAIKHMGGGDLGAIAVLASEVKELVNLLDSAGIAVIGTLTRRGLAMTIRNGYDPWGRRDRERGAVAAEDGIAPMVAGPSARDDEWSHIRADGAAHVTLWVAEWPRIDVRALFLQPLLMQTATTRTVAMVMELVGPSRATREVERSATSAVTDQSLRARLGQRTTRRQELKEESTDRRERELAEGHAEVRFAAYVGVSVPIERVDELESAVARVTLAAKRAPLTLERMWGQQAEAFTFLLPLCRGLR